MGKLDPLDNFDPADVICVNDAQGAVMDLGDGKEYVYLICLSGLMAWNDRGVTAKVEVGPTIYGMELADLCKVLANLFKTIVKVGKGTEAAMLLCAALGLDHQEIADLVGRAREGS